MVWDVGIRFRVSAYGVEYPHMVWVIVICLGCRHMLWVTNNIFCYGHMCD